MRIRGFDPEGKEPRALILGSMPGSKSPRLKEYYAHRRNAPDEGAAWRDLPTVE